MHRSDIKLPMLVIHWLRIVGDEWRSCRRARRQHQIQAHGQGDDFDGVAHILHSVDISKYRSQNAIVNEVPLMAHVLFGVACLVTTVWVFVDVLNISEANQGRIQKMSCAAATFMWLAFLAGGYWYVVYYKSDKAIILKGPWPFAHSFFMETKEHLVIVLLMLATYLPIAASSLSGGKEARRVVLWAAGMVALLALLMEGEGAIIAMGVKAGLLSR